MQILSLCARAGVRTYATVRYILCPRCIWCSSVEFWSRLFTVKRRYADRFRAAIFETKAAFKGQIFLVSKKQQQAIPYTAVLSIIYCKRADRERGKTDVFSFYRFWTKMVHFWHTSHPVSAIRTGWLKCNVHATSMSRIWMLFKLDQRYITKLRRYLR